VNENRSNLFESLRRWATGQDENFTTDAFAHLLRHLISEEPKTAARLLTKLTGQQCWDSLLQAPPQSRKLEIVTQDPGEEGVPDIKIKAPGAFVYIEVKVESDVDPDQLRRYRAEVDRAAAHDGAHDKALVLLTRKPVNVAQLPAPPNLAIRWFQVGEWLDDELRLANGDGKSGATAYLIGQFSEFLKARGMSMEKISWQLGEGIRSLVALLQMLKEAAVNSGAESTAAGAAMDSIGQSFSIGSVWYWTGLVYSEPETLHFAAYGVNKGLAEQIGHGSVKVWKPKEKNSYSWWDQLDLGSEKIHFFAKSMSSQIQCIEQFLKESIEAVGPSLGRKKAA
jgi:hypothetical protein